jgi:sulfite reductase alpha subunit-like flavoprotein
MNVSLISSSPTRRSPDFDALQSALQSGNITTAQGAFAAFQQDVQKTVQAAGPHSLFAPGTQTSNDLQNLGNALKSANLTGAQQAFATFKQDLQTAVQPASVPSISRARQHHSPANLATSSAATPSIGNILNLRA